MARLALPDPPLGDGAIMRRGFESTDVAAIVEICQDPDIPRWRPVPSPYGEDEARDYLAHVATTPPHRPWRHGPASHASLIQCAETARFANDIFFARLRDDAAVGG